MKYFQGPLGINIDNRVVLCDGAVEFHCGDTLEVEINGVWVPTRVECGNNGYYLVGLAGWNWYGKKARIEA